MSGAKTGKPGEWPETISVVDLADAANVTTRRIQQHADDGNIPRPEGKAGYPATRALRGLFKYYQDQAAGFPALKAKDAARMAAADADNAEMNAGRNSGVLMLASDVKKLWQDGFVKIRDAILRTPGITKKQKAEISAKLQKIRIG